MNAPSDNMTAYMTIKQSTLDDIKASLLINVAFIKYGSHSGAKTKISLTYHTAIHAFTVEAWASITHSRYLRLRSWDTLVSVLKPVDYSAIRTDKTTGEDITNSNIEACKGAFLALCEEVATRTDKVETDHYLSFRKK